MSTGFSNLEFKNFFYEAKNDATYVSSPFKSNKLDEILTKQNTEHAKNTFEIHIRNINTNSQKEKVIQDMITNDSDAPKNLDIEKMTRMIMKVSQETGTDPIVIASIAKKETHFNQNVPRKNGSGIMQLTSISIKDMFLRPSIYDESLKPILKKYRTPENLIRAMRKDPELNIKLGAILYKAKLKQAKGNEQKALELYNGSSGKKLYAQSVMHNINGIRQASSFDTAA